MDKNKDGFIIVTAIGTKNVGFTEKLISWLRSIII